MGACPLPWLMILTVMMKYNYNDVLMGAVASLITNLTIVYSSVYSGADQWKHQSSTSLAFVRGIHRRPVNSPHKWPVTRKIFSFDEVIMFHWVCMRIAIIKITVIWLFQTLHGSLHWACFANNDYLYKCLIEGMEIDCIYINLCDAIIYPWPNSMQIILVKFAVYSHCLVYLGSGPLVST